MKCPSLREFCPLAWLTWFITFQWRGSRHQKNLGTLLPSSLFRFTKTNSILVLGLLALNLLLVLTFPSELRLRTIFSVNTLPLLFATTPRDSSGESISWMDHVATPQFEYYAQLDLLTEGRWQNVSYANPLIYVLFRLLIEVS